MRKLVQITIRNYKSIHDQTLKLAPLNVFVGANDSGKSNFIRVFHFLRRIVGQQLQIHTAKEGGADALLHFGRKNSQYLKLEARFAEGEVANGYSLELVPTEKDRFAFSEENVWFHNLPKYRDPMDIQLGSGHVESKLSNVNHDVSKYLRQDIGSYQIYHFRDTSDSAKVRLIGDVDDNFILRPDAANLAAFLYRLKRANPEHFENIETTVRQITPFFKGFRLEPARPNLDKIRLEWRERENDDCCNASALSGGTLRFICLATLLLQPYLPPLILLDEPELDLHPAAMSFLVDLLKSVATRTQVIVVTKSVTLVRQFTPEQVWVVERREGASVFEHPRIKDMSNWF